MNYVLMVEDKRGDLIDLSVYCSSFCFERDTGTPATGHAWPCLEQADYDQYCEACGELILKGMDADNQL